MLDLNLIWFVLIGVLLSGYAILDGFDLGVGVLHLFHKKDQDRRMGLNAIGPVWDGNEVWLLAGGGALFAAFPPVYATVFSGFYLALIALLVALIFRAVSLEFRSKFKGSKWKKFWDGAFALGSIVPAILLGVAAGNILRGIPLNAAGVFTGNFLGLLNPFSLLAGVFSLVMFSLHGAVYMLTKTKGVLQKKIHSWVSPLWILFILLYFALTFYAFFEANHLFQHALGNPLTWIFFILLLASIIYLPVAVGAKKYLFAFIASAGSILSVCWLGAISLFPKLVPSSLNLLNSLTIYNASSTPKTLMTMLIIALLGVPIVLVYTAFIYRVFKGSVILGKDSY